MFIDRIKSIWLCLKYPFLYPRNRFTGLHYNNWDLLDWIGRKRKESTMFVNLTLTTNDVQGERILELTDERGILSLEIHGQEVWVVKSRPGETSFEKVLIKLKSPEKILDVGWGKNGRINVKVSKLPEEPRFISGQITINPVGLAISKVMDWFHSWPLQLFHCIPEYTELYALDWGWKKAFGEDLCKELRKALWKEGGLKAILQFRVIQIKEKYGYLHFYYDGGGDKVGEVISKYEKLSARTCIICGKPAKWRTRDWICPYCDDCISGNDPYQTAERIDENEDRDS